MGRPSTVPHPTKLTGKKLPNQTHPPKNPPPRVEISVPIPASHLPSLSFLNKISRRKMPGPLGAVIIFKKKGDPKKKG